MKVRCKCNRTETTLYFKFEPVCIKKQFNLKVRFQIATLCLYHPFVVMTIRFSEKKFNILASAQKERNQRARIRWVSREVRMLEWVKLIYFVILYVTFIL